MNSQIVLLKLSERLIRIKEAKLKVIFTTETEG